MKSLKGIKKYKGTGFDLILLELENKNTPINKIFNIIDANVSAFHPDHPFFELIESRNKKYMIIEKYKLLLLAFDLLSDKNKVSLEEDMEIRINSARFILQKFTYSLITAFELKLENLNSILGYVTLGKTLIDAISFEEGESISKRITNSFGSEVKKIGQEGSQMIKNPMVNKYLEDSKYNMQSFFEQLFENVINIPSMTIQTLIKRTKDVILIKHLNKILSYLESIDTNMNKEHPVVDSILFEKKYSHDVLLENVLLNEFLLGKKYANAVGYYNPVFLRLFIPLVNTITDEEKIELSNYSHKDLYAYTKLIKYTENGTGEMKNKYEKTVEVIDSVANKIATYLSGM